MRTPQNLPRPAGPAAMQACLAPLAVAAHLALAAAALSLGLPGQAGAQPAVQAARYDIPAGALADALNRFALQSGVAIVFDAASLRGLNSPGPQGRHGVEEGFDILLRGSGYAATKTTQGYVLRTVPAPASGQEAMLPPVQVEGSAWNDGTTEGSGSYTTRSTAAATGLPLSIRETPQSVTVVTRQRIDDQGLQDLGNILQNATGIGTLQLDSERTTFSSRGFPIDNLQYDGISTYYKSNYAAGESELDSIIYDRIEIVRGATGLLAGAGEPSASVNLVRKRADSRTFKAEASLSAGSWNNLRGTVDLSAPVTQDGRVRARVVASREDKEAFFDRYRRKRSVIHGVVDADLTPATTLSLGASYQTSDASGLTYGGVPLWYTDGTPTRFSRSFTVAPKWNREDVEIRNVFAHLEHRFDNGWNAQVRLVHNRSDVDNQRLFAWGFPDRATGLMVDTPSIGRFPGYRRQNSFDARFSGPFTLAGREHEAVVGLAHVDHRYQFDWIGSSTPWESPLGVQAFGAVPEPVWDFTTRELSERNHTKQRAVYGALRLSLADPLKLIVGGRLTRYHREGAGWASEGAYEYRRTRFVPYAGIVYDLSPRYAAYASYTGIFNYQDLRDRNGQWLEPVTGKAYETGLKGQFLDGRLLASLALFRIEQDHLAQEDAGHLVPGTDATAYYATSGAVSKGVEFELSGELAPDWNLAFGLTRFSAKDAQGKDVNTFQPRTLLRLFTAYRLPVDGGRLTLGGGVNWQSRIHYDNVGPNGENQEQGAYAVVNLMARYQFSPRLSLQLNLNNALDKRYQRAVNWYGQGVWGTPREVVATLRYKL